MPNGITALTRIIPKPRFGTKGPEYILYDIIDHKEAMRGKAIELALFLEIPNGNIAAYVKTGHTLRKRYKVRMVY